MGGYPWLWVVIPGYWWLLVVKGEGHGRMEGKGEEGSQEEMYISFPVDTRGVTPGPGQRALLNYNAFPHTD